MFRTGFATDMGNYKSVNEDTLLCDYDRGLFLVCDGMGGYEGGSVASTIVTDVISEELTNGKTLVDAIHLANNKVIEAAEKGLGSSSMGSTAVCINLNEFGFFDLAWVGDSRAYYITKDDMIMLTEDHTFVGLLLREGYIKESEVYDHPYKHILLQAVGGGKKEIYVSHGIGKLEKDATILLCCDGLTNEISDDEIHKIIIEAETLQEAADKLVNTAVDYGGRDNITAVLFSMDIDEADSNKNAKTQASVAIDEDNYDESDILSKTNISKSVNNNN